MILNIKELQFAMVAIPDVVLHHSHTLNSIDQALNRGEEVGVGLDLESASPVSVELGKSISIVLIENTNSPLSRIGSLQSDQI